MTDRILPAITLARRPRSPRDGRPTSGLMACLIFLQIMRISD
jgi:hypothetical protein